MKIGLVGGTFDPIHIGHLLLGQMAAEQLGLDEIWFLPAGMPYFKEGKQVSAVQDLPNAAVCDAEIRRGGRTYTCETVEMLNASFPEHAFYFIFGADCLDQLESWREPARILAGCRIVAAGRGKSADRFLLEEKAKQLTERFGGEILIMDFPVLEISSTMIRERAAAGLPLRFLVPPAVEEYIRQRKLYQNTEAGEG